MRKTVTILVPDGYVDATEFLKDCGFDRDTDADNQLGVEETQLLLLMLRDAEAWLGGFDGPQSSYLKVEALRHQIHLALQKYRWFLEQ
jgi:hypothetical protein